MAPKNPFPGVTRFTDRHGKIRWRLRVKVKGKPISKFLPGAFGSVEFRAAYEAAINGARETKAAKTRAKEDTLEQLIELYFGSIRFRDLSDIRKTTLRRELEWLRIQAGHVPYKMMEVRHVEALMARKTGPVAANTVKKNLSMLFNFASKNDWYKGNPAKFADARKENADGYHTWTEEEIDQFLAHHGPGTDARLAAMLVLNTGASRQDVCALGWQSIKRNRISYKRGKTGVGNDLPILPELATELANVPKDRMIFLATRTGTARDPAAFGNLFADWVKEAGLSGCAVHGLRKAGATRLADAGAAEFEVMSYLAHSTPKEAARYTKKASRSRLGDSGMAKLQANKPGSDVV